MARVIIEVAVHVQDVRIVCDLWMLDVGIYVIKHVASGVVQVTGEASAPCGRDREQ